MRSHPIDARMGDDERLGSIVLLDRIPEPIRMDMGKVYETASGVELAHQLATSIRQTATGSEPRGRRGGHPKHRAGQVHQSDANDRVIGNGSDAIGSSIQCVAALDRDHGSDRALSTSSTILGQRADEGHLAIGLRDDGAHAIEVAKQGAPSVLSGASNVRGDGPHGAGKATFEGAGKVDMTEETSSEGSTSMTREEVIAPQPVRN